jgi:pimeloyl-ACP methyl ester carboxylesterase
MKAARTLLAAAALTVGCVALVVVEGWDVVPQGSLYWEACGYGEERIVLLHGGGLDRRQWDDELEWLRMGQVVLRYDQRGHGRSPPPSGPFAPHEDLLELLDRRAIERALLVGHSNGGRVAIDFALLHPERVAGLFLLAPGLSGWSADPAELDAWLQPILAAVEAGDRERVLELWLASRCFSATREQPAAWSELERLARDNVETWFREPSELALEPPAAERLSDLAVPVRVLIGRRDAPDLLRIAEAIGAHVPHVEVVWIEGAGHALDLERPQAVRAELERFLDELDW